MSELELRPEEWPDILPLLQSALNNAHSPQRGTISPVTAFTGMDSTPPISTFLRSNTTTPVPLTDVQRERALNISALQDHVADLQRVVQQTVADNRRRAREAASRGELPRFSEGDYVLVARSGFNAGEKLALRWRGPRCIVKALSNYVFQVEDLCNGTISDIHGTRLKLYSDRSLDTTAIMSHVLSSEIGMPVARLMRLMDSPDGLQVQVRWRGLADVEDTLEPIGRVVEDVPQLLRKLLRRKNVPVHLVTKARLVLGL
jgi:hypothetical protein